MDYRRADASSISRAIEIGLCNVCLVLYLDPKNEGILLVSGYLLVFALQLVLEGHQCDRYKNKNVSTGYIEE